MEHEWDHKLEICKACGISKMEFLNISEWSALFCAKTPFRKTLKLPEQKRFCSCDIGTLMLHGCQCDGN